MMRLRDFEEIYALAAARKGGAGALEALLARTPSVPPEAVAAHGDDRVLAAMTRAVFAAGFSHRIIERKWPAFEQAFDGFDPRSNAAMSEERFDALLGDAAIVRSPRKIRSVALNAQWVLAISELHGSAARYLAAWPDEEFTVLVGILRRGGDHMGGETAMRFLRSLGKPAFVTSEDMLDALRREGVSIGTGRSAADLRTVNEALCHWSSQSGRDLTAISRILSMSVGAMPAQHPWEKLGL